MTCYECNINATVLFIDFKKAYDSIKRNNMIRAMEELNVPSKLIRLVKLTLNNTTSTVRIQGEISDNFYVETSWRQGHPLSTLLFHLALEKIIRN